MDIEDFETDLKTQVVFCLKETVKSTGKDKGQDMFGEQPSILAESDSTV